MSTLDVIRAWKDEEYRASLSDAQRAMLPEHPAGLIDLSEADLDQVGGANNPYTVTVCTYDYMCTGDLIPCTFFGGCSTFLFICPLTPITV
jgi:mersacidin/lichenicidin family type 2 lantibiotic